MSVPFVKLGMHAGMAATYTLPNVVGQAHARDLLLTGRMVGADEASAVTYISVFMGEGPDEGPLEIDQPGGLVEFHNIFRRTPDGWRIAFHASKGVMTVRK